MSQSRAILRRMRAKNSTLDLLLFGPEPPPSGEHAAERNELRNKFLRTAGEFKAHDYQKLWRYLRQARNDYEPEKHGLSFTMSMVDSVAALRVEESRFRLECAWRIQEFFMACEPRKERNNEQSDSEVLRV